MCHVERLEDVLYRRGRIGQSIASSKNVGGFDMRTLGTIGAGLLISLAVVGIASAGVIEHQTLKGKAASAEFMTSTPETCADGSEGSLDVFVGVNGEESF